MKTNVLGYPRIGEKRELKKMNTTLLSSHLMTCGKDKLSSPSEAEGFVQEFLRKSTITQANFAAAAGPLAVIRFPSCTTSSSLKIAPLCCK